MPPKCVGKKLNKHNGMFQVGSTLSFDVNLVGFTTNIIPNIPEISMSSLPLSFTTEKHAVAPKN